MIKDVVIDTDAFNEVDDQFALCYLLASKELNLKQIYAAPFFNFKVNSPKEGMKKSYNEIFNVLKLAKKEEYSNVVFEGSENYLKDENTPQISDAAKALCELATGYSKENPLYVVAIGAITDIASALLLKPDIADKIAVVSLGGHSHEYFDTAEFNMRQDIAASRVVMSKTYNFTQLPCMGVVNQFSISKPEIKENFIGKTPLSDYLGKSAIKYTEIRKKEKHWTKPVWDVCAVACLLNDDNRFMLSKIEKTYLSGYDMRYEQTPIEKPMNYVYFIKRDILMDDLIEKILSL